MTLAHKILATGLAYILFMLASFALLMYANKRAGNLTVRDKRKK